MYILSPYLNRCNNNVHSVNSASSSKQEKLFSFNSFILKMHFPTFRPEIDSFQRKFKFLHFSIIPGNKARFKLLKTLTHSIPFHRRRFFFRNESFSVEKYNTAGTVSNGETDKVSGREDERTNTRWFPKRYHFTTRVYDSKDFWSPIPKRYLCIPTNTLRKIVFATKKASSSGEWKQLSRFSALGTFKNTFFVPPPPCPPFTQLLITSSHETLSSLTRLCRWRCGG